jgi:hypothetical protein
MTLKGKSLDNDTGTGAGRNQWEKLLQNTSKFIPDYIPSHSGRQAVSPVQSQHDEHISLHLKQKQILCVAVIGCTMLALENSRFDVECNLKVHDILIHTFTNALFYTLLVFLNKWA